MEYFDIVDDLGLPTGEIAERTEAHSKGLQHRSAHIWIVRIHEGRKQALLQKRSMIKDSFPGRYDTSSAGHITTGQEPEESALRELCEELGIKAAPEDLTFIGCFRLDNETEFYGKPFRNHEVAFEYVYTGSVDASSLVLQAEEVESTAWFDLDEIQYALSVRDPRFCVPRAGFKKMADWCSENL